MKSKPHHKRRSSLPQTPQEDYQLNALISLITNYEDDHLLQNTTVTAIVFSIWQLTSRGTSLPAPSLMLIKPEQVDSCATYNLLDKLTPTNNYYYTGSEGLEPCSVDQASALMKIYYNQRKNNLNETKVEAFHKVREIGYGQGIKCPYAAVWHPKLGLITDNRDGIILTLASEKDITTFRDDVSEHSPKLISPKGPGGDLEMQFKTISVLGSIPQKHFNSNFVTSLLEHGSVSLYLPCLKSDTTDIENLQAIKTTVHIMQNALIINALIINAKSRVINTNHPWFRSYYNYLYSRLEHLPLACRFPILTTLHQLHQVCAKIVAEAVRFYTSLPAIADKLAMTLLMHSVRGLTLSIAGLAWVGVGFTTSCNSKQLEKTLKVLRAHESISRRDLHRKARFKTAACRDLILTELESEGLVSLKGNSVIAITLEQFTRSLHDCCDFPSVPDLGQH